MTAPIPSKLHIVKHPAPPGSPEWCRLVTASKVAGIVGESRYATPYSVHCQMNGVSEGHTTMSDRFNAGHAFELAIAEWVKLDHPEWTLSRGEVQVTNPHLPFPNAATPDRIATNNGRTRGPKHSRTLQFKTVQDWEEWSNLTGETLPPDWLIQVTWEMLTSGLTRHPAVLVALGPYYTHEYFEVPFDAEFAQILVDQVTAFVARLDGEPPAPTSPNDYKIARLRHPDIDDDVTVTLDADLADEWNEAKSRQKAADAEARKAKADAEAVAARVLEAMSGAGEATDPDGVVVAARTANKNGVVSLKHKTPKPAKAAA